MKSLSAARSGGGGYFTIRFRQSLPQEVFLDLIEKVPLKSFPAKK
jgi:hypothetical protein